MNVRMGIFIRRFTLAWIVMLIGAQGETQAAPQKRNPEKTALWTPLKPESLPDVSQHPLLSRVARFRAYQLDWKALRSSLLYAPMEFVQDIRQSPVEISLPTPEGKLARFRVVESSILGPDLARERPDIKTFAAQGIDDPTATARLDLTPDGFHAMILSPQGQVFIDPYCPGDTTRYLVVAKQDVQPGAGRPECLTDGITMRILPDAPPARQRYVTSGSYLRTYRLALSCTGEYTVAAGGTVTAAQNRMVTTVNRVNGVYEKDFTLRMVLVATRIYTSGAGDPFTNHDPFALLEQNQTELDTNVGPENYDFGHIFSTGGGGVAYLEAVCVEGLKAQGTSGLPNPVGDPFDIDYVAHEMGHQFGADHSFNGTAGFCSGNRYGPTAYEPGSGSTIMSYAGICSGDNLQAHSDPYFHTGNLDQVIAFRDNGGTCVAEVATGNTPPSVEAGSDFTIPTGTPFTLTATAFDGDGDKLTYCWEQFDLGTTTTTRPLFRSFSPTTDPSRTFPRLSLLLANSTNAWEASPTVSRTMKFRCTVRDNRAGGGGIHSDQMTITVAGAPFAVTAPNTAVTWFAGESQTVTWNVGGGSVAPNVRILLSTDGGNTFAPLLESTPNDGSEAITVPFLSATQCRIKIEAIDNIFFDISNVDFSIQPHNVSGEITLEDAVQAAQTLTFEFRSAAGAPITRTQTLTPTGTSRGRFTFNDVPPDVYNLAVKGTKWLRKVLSVDTTAASVTDLAATLTAGDTDDSNSIDVLDLDLLIQAFDTVPGDSLWNENADFNCDGAVDILDLAILLRNFDRSGED